MNRNIFKFVRLAGPILESKGIRAIFQKKDKKGQNICKFGQKCAKYFEKGQPRACDYRTHETAGICLG